MRLSAVILTKNVREHIADCVESVRFADEVVVVDSGSVDGTAELALSLGCRVVMRPLDDFASQRNHGLEIAAGDWVVMIDADERVDPLLGREIQEIARAKGSADGYPLRRVNRVFGFWLDAPTAEEQIIRLFRRHKVRFEGKVHERAFIAGQLGRAPKGKIRHHSFQNISDYMRRFLLYTRLEADACLPEQRSCGASAAAARVLYRFLQVYFWKGAFLKGFGGYQFAALSAWYEWVKRMYALERRAYGEIREKSNC